MLVERTDKLTSPKIYVPFTRGITCCWFQELEEFWSFQDLLPKLVQQLSYCVTMELIPLMEIPGVKQVNIRVTLEVVYPELYFM